MSLQDGDKDYSLLDEDDEEEELEFAGEVDSEEGLEFHQQNLESAVEGRKSKFKRRYQILGVLIGLFSAVVVFSILIMLSCGITVLVVASLVRTMTDKHRIIPPHWNPGGCEGFLQPLEYGCFNMSALRNETLRAKHFIRQSEKFTSIKPCVDHINEEYKDDHHKMYMAFENSTDCYVILIDNEFDLYPRNWNMVSKSYCSSGRCLENGYGYTHCGDTNDMYYSIFDLVRVLC